MVTCQLRYVIDPDRIADFEGFARLWLRIVPRLGGTHHGYFLPHEGANNIAFALFSFPSLAAYEVYRQATPDDAECREALALYARSRCVVSYERTFLRPLLTPEG